MTSFLLVHGWQNRRPPGHWQHWLAGELSAAGHEVSYPQFPTPDEPARAEWTALLRSSLSGLGRSGSERVLICHSLAVPLWWGAAAELGELQADRVLLVAPPSPEVLREHREVAAFADGFAAPGPDADVRRRVRLVASDDDPYWPGGALPGFADPCGLDADLVAGGAHLDLPAGYGSWPSVLAWCTDPVVRITGR
ncbi:RBBP9/YdeN family alpha/beta hydrolase [Blastococcus sp. SYSU D00820]